MFSERAAKGLNDVKTEFSTPLREQAPPDFKKAALFGEQPVLGRTLMVRDQDAVNVIKWVEVFTSRGRCVLNGTNPLSWEWIAQVHYGLFNYPIRVVMYPHIPEDAAEVVRKLLEAELFGNDTYDNELHPPEKDRYYYDNVMGRMMHSHLTDHGE